MNVGLVIGTTRCLYRLLMKGFQQTDAPVGCFSRRLLESEPLQHTAHHQNLLDFTAAQLRDVGRGIWTLGNKALGF